MEILESVYQSFVGFVPSGIVLVVVVVGLWLANRLLLSRARVSSDRHFRRQLVMLGLSVLGLILIVLVSPLPESMRGQLLALFGLLISAAITLSSTTLIGNALAGFMLRFQHCFRAGDFIEVENLLGRVSERGLFHTQIQVESRDLTNVPNLYLATHPVTVIRGSGTIVSANVSLGYDVPHEQAEDALKLAAENAGLQEPFVQIRELGDFSIAYRTAGLLTETKQLLSARSRLRREMIDALHGAGVEIISPTFMNTRAYSPDLAFVPPANLQSPGEEAGEDDSRLQSLVFDKADEAESVENLRTILAGLDKKIAALEREAKKLEDVERESVEDRLGRLRDRRQRIVELLDKQEET